MGAWLDSHKTYPDEARRRGEQGRVVVRFTADAGGSVSHVEIVRAAGSQALDDAVQHMLAGARLPRFPPGMTEASVTVTVGIRFALDGL